jgi:hypothetical protein
MREQPSCFNCRHFKMVEGGIACEAFGGPIPFLIASGQVDHTKPVDGDNGIQWEPVEGYDE